MATPSGQCSIVGCKRAVTCLCRHCQQDVCLKHFTEHQTQINNELPTLTDRLNELHSKLQLDEDRCGPLIQFKEWRSRKYQEIDREYALKVKEFMNKVSEQQEQVCQVNRKIDELVKEGDASHQQVQDMKETVRRIEIEVNNLMAGEQIDGLELIGTYVQMGEQRYLVKGKVTCGNSKLYAVESEKPVLGYNGKCPVCDGVHLSLAPDRGFYTSVKTLREMVNREILRKNARDKN